MPYKIEVKAFRFEGSLLKQRDLLVQLLADSALYTTIELQHDEFEKCLELLYLFGLRFDEWCVECNAASTFVLERLLDDHTLGLLEKAARREYPRHAP